MGISEVVILVASTCPCAHKLNEVFCFTGTAAGLGPRRTVKLYIGAGCTRARGTAIIGSKHLRWGCMEKNKNAFLNHARSDPWSGKIPAIHKNVHYHNKKVEYLIASWLRETKNM